MPERRRPTAAVYAPETSERGPVGTECRRGCCWSPYGHSTVRDSFPQWHAQACHCHNPKEDHE